MKIFKKMVLKCREFLRGHLNSKNEKLPIDKFEAIDLFKLDPLHYFKAYRGCTYSWALLSESPTYLENIYVKVGNFSIGYIHGININMLTKQVTISHFAIEKDLATRQGLGKILAFALRQKLISIYGTRAIIFSENHSDYSNLPYSDFFKSLGAVQNQKNSNRVWYWDLS